MKKIVILWVLFMSSLSLASQTLSVEDFQASDYLKYTVVQATELVFTDELTQEAIYKVNFEYETSNCASNGEFDFCEWLPTCEYLKVDTATSEIIPTQITCDQDLETLIGDTGLIDEL